jgi:YHS domain-containing protein
MKILIGISALLIILSGCGQQTSTEIKEKTVDSAKPVSKIDFTHIELASKKDLACGMPLSAGLEDTAVYKGKVYGFCSPECKADFEKDPEAALAKAK